MAIVIFSIVLIVIIAIFLIVSLENHSTVLVSNDPDAIKLYNLSYNSAVDQANLSKYTSAINILDNIKTTNNTERSQVALELAGIYYQQKQYDKALDYYKLAYSLNPSSLNDTQLSIMASIYASENNKQMAIQYYQAAINLANKPGQEFSAFKVPSWQYEIKTLEQQ
jgi:tetratricopeptide (TPR) repeat protein